MRPTHDRRSRRRPASRRPGPYHPPDGPPPVRGRRPSGAESVAVAGRVCARDGRRLGGDRAAGSHGHGARAPRTATDAAMAMVRLVEGGGASVSRRRALRKRLAANRGRRPRAQRVTLSRFEGAWSATDENGRSSPGAGSTLELLEAARELIADPARWVRPEWMKAACDPSGRRRDPQDARAVRWSAAGAIRHVAWAGDGEQRAGVVLRAMWGHGGPIFEDCHSEAIELYDRAIRSWTARHGRSGA